MRTKKFDLLIKGFKAGLAASFVHRDPELAKQLHRAAWEAQNFQDYESSRPLRVSGVTLPVAKARQGDAIAEFLNRFYGLEYMKVESFDVEVLEKGGMT